MAHPYHHALSSVKKWGGLVEDYQPIHDWFDETKKLLPDFRHRALRHHAEGIFLCEQIHGTTIPLSTCKHCGITKDEHVTPWRGSPTPVTCNEFVPKRIPVRWIGEQHVQEDLGRIPTATDWLQRISAEPWMYRSRKLSRELEKDDECEFVQEQPHEWRCTVHEIVVIGSTEEPVYCSEGRKATDSQSLRIDPGEEADAKFLRKFGPDTGN